MARVDDQVVQHVAEQAELTPSYLVFMALAGVLAAVALLANSVPILVGAMVVAPALAPLALVAFALAGGQPGLALRGLGVGLLGLLVATICAMGTTWVMNLTDVIPPESNLLNKPLLEERVRPGWYGLAAAFAAGIVGTVALAKQKTDTLVGTVAALALVPAAAAAGIAFISRDPLRGLGGLLLLGMNVGLIIAMGLLTLPIMLRSGQEQPGRGRDGVPAWGLVLVALAIIALVSGLLAWFTTGPGKGLRTPPALSAPAPALGRAARGLDAASWRRPG